MNQPRERLEAQISIFLQTKEYQRAIEIALLGDAEAPGYRDEFLGYLYKELSDEESTKEVFARFSQRLWAGLSNFRQESSFRTWAYTVLKNTLLTFQEETRKQQVTEVRFQTSESSTGASGLSASKLEFDGSSPSSLFRQEEAKTNLRALYRKLSQSDQDLLSMIVERGMSHEQVASALSTVLNKKVSPETIRQRYHRTQERLKKLAEEAGYLG